MELPGKNYQLRLAPRQRRARSPQHQTIDLRALFRLALLGLAHYQFPTLHDAAGQRPEQRR